MRKLNTVRGIISADEAKVICPHEHVFVDGSHEAVEPKTEQEKALFYGDVHMDVLGVLRRNPYVIRTNLILDEVETEISELRFLSEYNCNLLVDVTVPGINRDVKTIQHISKETGIEMIAATGLFVEEAVKEPYLSWSAQQIRDWMIDEIESGIDGTGIKPGVYKIATSEKLQPLEVRTLEAVAAAYQKYPLPVYVHVFPWAHTAIDAIYILTNGGVAPKDICICHLDVSFNESYIKEVLQTGAYVEFDNFSKEFYFEPQEGAFSGGPFETDLARVKMAKKLISEGYGEKLLFANDLCLKESWRKYGGWGYDHIFRNIIPMMRTEGISEEDIRQIIEINPKQFLFDL